MQKIERYAAWTEGPFDSTRCTETVLNQFGIFGKAPRDGLGVLETLMNNGWTYRAVDPQFRGTVKAFCDQYPTGKYYFASSGHAMALIDGLLVDAEGRGPDERRVIGAFEVYRPGERTAAKRLQQCPHCKRVLGASWPGLLLPVHKNEQGERCPGSGGYGSDPPKTAAVEHTVRLYHGTNTEALVNIRREGQLRAVDLHALANAIEQRYGLDHDSVWNHQWNEFARGRNDRDVFFSTDPRVAEQYARSASEPVTDALKTVYRIHHPDDADFTWAEQKQWVEQEVAKYYTPIVLALDVPYSVVAAGFPKQMDWETYQNYFGGDHYHNHTLHGPVPASWIVSEQRLGWRTAKVATGPNIVAKDYEGEVGNKQHVTRHEDGTLPTYMLANMPGVNDEVPGQHINRTGDRWTEFLDDIKTNGIQHPIFITVDHGDVPKISEGNHRRDAAVELGHESVPVEIRYFGHAEQEGTVAERKQHLHHAVARQGVYFRVAPTRLRDTIQAEGHRVSRSAHADIPSGVYLWDELDAALAYRDHIAGQEPQDVWGIFLSDQVGRLLPDPLDVPHAHYLPESIPPGHGRVLGPLDGVTAVAIRPVAHFVRPVAHVPRAKAQVVPTGSIVRP